MAKQLPKKAEENTGEWLNTYADMVTLLLTFFVLLFACSNMDETKIQYIMQAFQMRGKFTNTIIAPPNADPDETNQVGNSSDPPTTSGGEGEMPQSFDTLFQYLGEIIDSNDLGDVVSVESGASHITIKFNDSVMFRPDSAVLTSEGRQIISTFVPAIQHINNSVQTLTVAGHTARSGGSDLNDYSLSANRAVSVQNLLEFLHTVDNEKYIVTGYGPNRPTESNETVDGRAKNRRVEIQLLKAENELDFSNRDVLKDFLTHHGITNEQFDAQFPPVDPVTLPEGAADRVEAFIKDKFENVGVSVGGFGPGSADGSEFIADETTSS